MVASVHLKYPAAFELLENQLNLSDAGITGLFLSERIDWYRYKRFLRELEELLNACIVLSPEKIQNRWQDISGRVDTRILFDHSGEAEIK